MNLDQLKNKLAARPRLQVRDGRLVRAAFSALSEAQQEAKERGWSKP